MCLLLFAVEAHPRYRLIIAANRDEFYARPTEQAHLWDDRSGTLAGVDRLAGGTWLGITKSGRFAALTNYRDPRDMRPPSPDEPSRGALVARFLAGTDEPEAHLASVSANGPRYRGFNLIAGDSSSLVYISNRGGRTIRIPTGVHGLSNHLLDTPWPKVERGKAGLLSLIQGGGELLAEALLALMADETAPADNDLPDTGVGLVAERMLSPMFIRASGYGTRSTTVLLVERSGDVTFVERTHAPLPLPDVVCPFRIQA